MSRDLINVKKALASAIDEICASSRLFVRNPKSDFTRKRKISFRDILLFLLCKEGGNLTTELFRYFKLTGATASVSALIQQRDKVRPDAFIMLFRLFSKKACPQSNYKGLRLFAADSSDIQVSTNPNDTSSYFAGSNGQAPYNLFRLNALYDLKSNVYVDVETGGRRTCSETRSLCQMIDRSTVERALVIADRGYASYNLMAHAQEKEWFFLIRAKDSNGFIRSFELPESPEFDMPVQLSLCRKRTVETRQLFCDRNHYRFLPATMTFDFLPGGSRKNEPTVFYKLFFRLIRLKLSDGSYEVLLTNLPVDKFPIGELKILYYYRWGIETSFRSLKYTVGLLHFHAQRSENILKEIFARLTLYNFASLTVLYAAIPNRSRKYCYKVKFSAAVHLCRQLIRRNISLSVFENLLLRQSSPVRSGRKFPRVLCPRKPVSFSYRIA